MKIVSLSLLFGEFLCVVGLPSSSLLGQEVILIHGEPTHEIVVKPMGFYLGQESDPAHASSEVVRNSQGQFITGTYPLQRCFEFAVYDSAGVFLTTVGRDGEGPGEFSGMERVAIGPDGTLFFIDRGGVEIEIYSAAFEPARTVNLRGFDGRYVVGVEGGVVVNGWPVSRELAGYLALFVSNDGEVKPLVRSDQPMVATGNHTWMRKMAAGEGETVWLMSVSEYRLEQWSLDGELVRVLERRDLDWFQPGDYVPMTPQNYQDRDSPFILDVWAGPEGLLYVSYGRDISSRSTMFLDAVDPKTGRLVASLQFPVSDEKIGRLFLDGTGYVRTRLADFYAIVELSLRRPGVG